eukprot:evm.model.scf_336.5 EVM.evm.TU.scf_336.5   scf_336:60598-75964(-)
MEGAFSGGYQMYGQQQGAQVARYAQAGQQQPHQRQQQQGQQAQAQQQAHAQAQGQAQQQQTQQAAYGGGAFQAQQVQALQQQGYTVLQAAGAQGAAGTTAMLSGMPGYTMQAAKGAGAATSQAVPAASGQYQDQAGKLQSLYQQGAQLQIGQLQGVAQTQLYGQKATTGAGLGGAQQTVGAQQLSQAGVQVLQQLAQQPNAQAGYGAAAQAVHVVQQKAPSQGAGQVQIAYQYSTPTNASYGTMQKATGFSAVDRAPGAQITGQYGGSSQQQQRQQYDRAGRGTYGSVQQQSRAGMGVGRSMGGRDAGHGMRGMYGGGMGMNSVRPAMYTPGGGGRGYGQSASGYGRSGGWPERDRGGYDRLKGRMDDRSKDRGPRMPFDDRVALLSSPCLSTRPLTVVTIHPSSEGPRRATAAHLHPAGAQAPRGMRHGGMVFRRDDRKDGSVLHRDAQGMSLPPSSKPFSGPPTSREPIAAKDAKTSHSSPAHRPPPEYGVRVPHNSFVTCERDYTNISRRYSHLYISADFTKLVSCWTKIEEKLGSLGCRLFPLDRPAKFENTMGILEPEAEFVPPTAKCPPRDGQTSWKTKVVPLSGLDSQQKMNVLRGSHNEGGTTMAKSLKFLAVREEDEKHHRSGIMCLGGPWDAKLDGDNPEKNPQALINSCIRHVKAQADLDLSVCTQWVRFCEIHFQREMPDGTEASEVTVVFLVDVDKCLPDQESWPDVWKERLEWKKAKKISEDAEKQDEAPTKGANGHGTEAALSAKETDQMVTDAKEGVTKAAEPGVEAAKDKEVMTDAPAAEEVEDGNPKEGTVGSMAEGVTTNVEEPGVSEGADEEMTDATKANGEVKAAEGGTHSTEAVTEANTANDEAAKADPAGAADKKVEEPKAQQEEPPPKETSILVKARNTTALKLRTMTISLDGLLDYDEGDKEEATFELSLFAEGFHEMLMRDYGLIILEALESERAAARLRKQEEQKRKKEEEAEAAMKDTKDEERVAKRVKTEYGVKTMEAEPAPQEEQQIETKEETSDAAIDITTCTAEGAKPGNEADGQPVDVAQSKETIEGLDGDGKADPAEEGARAEGTGGDVEMDRGEAEGAVGDGAEDDGKHGEVGAKAAEGGEVADKAKEGAKASTKEMEQADASGKQKEAEVKEAKKKKRYRVDEKLLMAFRYFDRTGCGYIKSEDLRRMLHNLGRSMPPRTVRDLVANVVDRSSRYKDRDTRVYYRDLTDKEIVEEEKVAA